MGVDSGFPDFRGAEGFWRAYPAFREKRLDFSSMASPAAFRTMPAHAWGFYGHRLALYRRTVPHAGFAILKRWGESMSQGYRADLQHALAREGHQISASSISRLVYQAPKRLDITLLCCLRLVLVCTPNELLVPRYGDEKHCS